MKQENLIAKKQQLDISISFQAIIQSIKGKRKRLKLILSKNEESNNHPPLPPAFPNTPDPFAFFIILHFLAMCYL